jgi:hypothetical protein
MLEAFHLKPWRARPALTPSKFPCFVIRMPFDIKTIVPLQFEAFMDSGASSAGCAILPAIRTPNFTGF